MDCVWVRIVFVQKIICKIFGHSVVQCAHYLCGGRIVTCDTNTVAHTRLRPPFFLHAPVRSMLMFCFHKYLGESCR